MDAVQDFVPRFKLDLLVCWCFWASKAKIKVKVPVNSQGTPWVEYHPTVPRGKLCSAPPPSTLAVSVVDRIISLNWSVTLKPELQHLKCHRLYSFREVWLVLIFASRNFPETSILPAAYIFFTKFIFLTIFLLTFWHFPPKIPLSSLEHLLHERRGRGCRRFDVGVRDFGVCARKALRVFWHPQLNIILHLWFEVWCCVIWQYIIREGGK